MQFEPHTLWQLADHLLVRCPRCDRRAHLRWTPGADGQSTGCRLACPGCGASAVWPEEPGGGVPYPQPGPEQAGGLQLWLQVPCCGEVLWAFNPTHLAFLEAYIGSRLRERRRDPRGGWSNRSLQSRLPRWMVLAGNREAVVAGLAALRERAAGGAEPLSWPTDLNKNENPSAG